MFLWPAEMLQLFTPLLGLFFALFYTFKISEQ